MLSRKVVHIAALMTVVIVTLCGCMNASETAERELEKSVSTMRNVSGFAFIMTGTSTTNNMSLDFVSTGQVQQPERAQAEVTIMSQKLEQIMIGDDLFENSRLTGFEWQRVNEREPSELDYFPLLAMSLVDLVECRKNVTKTDSDNATEDRFEFDIDLACFVDKQASISEEIHRSIASGEGHASLQTDKTSAKWVRMNIAIDLPPDSAEVKNETSLMVVFDYSRPVDIQPPVSD